MISHGFFENTIFVTCRAPIPHVYFKFEIKQGEPRIYSLVIGTTLNIVVVSTINIALPTRTGLYSSTKDARRAKAKDFYAQQAADVLSYAYASLLESKCDASYDLIVIHTNLSTVYSTALQLCESTLVRSVEIFGFFFMYVQQIKVQDFQHCSSLHKYELNIR